MKSATNKKQCWGVEELFLAIEALEMLGAYYRIEKVLSADETPVPLFVVDFTMEEGQHDVEIPEDLFHYDD